jgi:hypothetical protein
MTVRVRYEMCFNEVTITTALSILSHHFSATVPPDSGAPAAINLQDDVVNLRPQIYRMFLRSRAMEPSSPRGWRLYLGENLEYEAPQYAVHHVVQQEEAL